MLYSPPPTTTSELQLNYRATTIKNCLKTSWTEVLSLRIIRNSHVKTGRGRDIEQAGPTPTVWWLKKRRYISAEEVPPEEQGVAAPYQVPQLGTLVPGRGVSLLLVLKTSEDYGWVRWRATGVSGILHKGPMHRLIHGYVLSFSAGAAAWKTPETYGEELNWLASGWRLEGQGSGQLTWEKRAGRPYCSFVEVLHQLLASTSGTKPESPTTCLTLFLCGDCLRPLPHPIWVPSPNLFQRLFCTNVLLAYTVDFPKISQRSTNPKQAACCLGVHHTSC